MVSALAVLIVLMDQEREIRIPPLAQTIESAIPGQVVFLKVNFK
jgi:hypothetical protein